MDYLKSLEKAITLIEDRLGDISVEEVAREAGYSYYHLNRLFTSILGESVGSYIKKRRLADGAKKLLYTNKRVIDIAIENGFESSEAFSRAFKSMYRTSPVFYRKNRLDVIIGAKKQINSEFLRHIATGVTVKPRILETGEIRVAGIRGNTTLNQNTIPRIWEKFWKIRPSIPNTFRQSRAFGICEACGMNETVYTMNGDVSFTEVAGTEVSGFNNMPDGVITKTLRAGRYAVFTHTGSLKNLMKTFDYIWGTWLTGTKEQLDDREDFELYDERFLGYDNPESQMDIYIPIK